MKRRKTYHGEKPPFEYSQITRDIYIGTNACCMTHFDKGLIKKRIRADISLEDVRIDQPYGVKFYLWLPTRNHYAPSAAQLELGARTIDRLVRNKIKVYVHCRNGHGRAPTLVAAYFILKGMSVKEAVEAVKKKRPVAHPNKRQVSALRKFYNKVSKKR